MKKHRVKYRVKQQTIQDRTWAQAEADVERVIREAQAEGLDWSTHVVLVFDPNSIGVPPGMRGLFGGRPAVMIGDREESVSMAETIYDGIREHLATFPPGVIPIIVHSGESVALRATRVVMLPSTKGAAN